MCTGLPRPRVNRPVYAVDGWFLGIPDLLDEESGLVAEYDGAGHREAKQHARDNAREKLMEHHGLVVVRACASDLGAHRLHCPPAPSRIRARQAPVGKSPSLDLAPREPSG